MARKEIDERYFDWMYFIAFGNNPENYRTLLRYLHSVPFRYSIIMDANREEDGIALRYRFGADHGYSQNVIASELDRKPCSVLEMLVALVLRCGENLLLDPVLGTCTDVLFSIIMDNLKLSHMTDNRFNKERVDTQLDIFMDRRYNRDGSGGGLFTIDDPSKDMRIAEIWKQTVWFLNSIL